jgi:NADH-quinone oxidoreductase subunit G
MPTVYVNDRPVEIGNDRLNCVTAAARAGVEVPHYCYHEALSVVASCRMCLVEVGELKDGKVLMQPKVSPGCQTPVKDGTVVVTGDYRPTPGVPPLPYDAAYKPGEKARKSQADTLEGLLLNHPLDCPVCDKAGECKLQDYSYQYGRSESRLVDDKLQPPNKPHISSKITLFTDRCILCSRCVRFTREISGTSELTVISRGHHAEIDVFPGRPLENKLSGNVVDLCPVGALGSKDFLYTQRVWYLSRTDGVCNRCSTGCSTHVDSNKGIVYRLVARENPQAQGHFICDEGRWGYHYTKSPDRLTRPRAKAADGTLRAAPWAEVLPKLKADLTRAGAGLVGVLSPFLTVEEAFLLGTFVKSVGGRLALGPVPVVGEDDRYPKDVRGNPPAPGKEKFTIRAEKAPNRVGVEAVLQHLEGKVVSFADVRGATAALFAGGYPDPAALDPLLADHSVPPLLAVLDLFAHGLAKRADYLLPAASVFETDGTFVNHAGLAQTFGKAVKPPTEVRGALQLAADLLGRKGLVQAAAVRKEVAAAVPRFAGLPTDVPAKAGKKLELATV